MLCIRILAARSFSFIPYISCIFSSIFHRFYFSLPCGDPYPLLHRNQLSCNACLHSTAKGTISKYIREINSLFHYQKVAGLSCSLTADVTHSALFLSRLLYKRRVFSVSMAHTTLKWVHSILPLDSNPLDAGICKKLVEADKRSRLEPIKKKEPVSLALIWSIVSTYADERAYHKSLRFAMMCVLSFAGLFRPNELLNIRGCHITVLSDHVIIGLPDAMTYTEKARMYLNIRPQILPAHITCC